MKKNFKTDWLNTVPVFYNTETKVASYNINDVIDYNNLEFDAEGLANYLDFGYCVLGMTPIKNVKFLRWSAELEVDEGKSLNITLLDDPAEEYEGKRIPEKDIWEMIHSEVNSYTKPRLIVPTSGGHDSRIINFLIDDKSKILAYTYGLSENQTVSYEVQFAKKLCSELKINWQQIPLGSFHNRIPDWFDLFGVSTHTHGMYHMEFYDKIINSLPVPLNDCGLVSGIIGDAWAGTVTLADIPSAENFNRLGYTHGINADSKFCRLKTEREYTANFLNENRGRLQSEFWQVVLTMRLKMMLLSYLVKVPMVCGIPEVYTPYLNIDIALGMLNIPPERRRNRLWQREFFAKHGIDVESRVFFYDPQNCLDFKAMQEFCPPPLNVKLLRELFSEEYLHWINNNYFLNNSSALNAYYTLKSLQMLLEERNASRRGRGGQKVSIICNKTYNLLQSPILHLYFISAQILFRLLPMFSFLNKVLPKNWSALI